MLKMVQPNSTVIVDLDGELKTYCTINYDNSSVYTNSMIVSVTSIFGYLFVGTLINILEKKTLLVILGMLAGVMGTCIYFAQTSAATIALSSLFLTLVSVNTNVLLTIIVDLFPTTFRTMTVALSMMFSRSGAMIGNIVMPHLLSAGCLHPFLFIGIAAVTTATMGIFLPKTDMKALE